MSAQEPELEVPEIEELDTAFRRTLALAVALLALFGGVVGFAAGDAGAREERLGADAQRASVIAMSRNSAMESEYYEMLQNSLDVSSLQRRGDIAQVRASLGLRSQQDLARKWETAAGQLTDMSVLAGNGKYANNRGLLYADLYAGPDLAALRQQAADETSASWGQKRRLEIGIVTLVAVALTLLGLSLTVGREVRRYLIWPAALIVGVCVAGFVWVLNRPVPHTPEAAMNAVVDGDRLYLLGDYQGAVNRYARALTIRPDYPSALQHLAPATLMANSPERNTGQNVINTSTPQAYRAAIADLNRALRVTGDDYPTLLNLGGAYFHVRDYADSAQLSQRAIDLNPGPPLPYMNLGLALLAEGDRSKALRTYNHAIQIILSRSDPSERDQLFSAALTTLETLAIQQPHSLAMVRQVEGALIAAESKMQFPHAPSASNTTISALQMKAAVPLLGLQFTYAGLPKGGRLAYIIYFRPRGMADWVQRGDLNDFESIDLPPSGSKKLPLPDDTSCPTAVSIQGQVVSCGFRSQFRRLTRGARACRRVPG